jgi:hypothetical protein
MGGAKEEMTRDEVDLFFSARKQIALAELWERDRNSPSRYIRAFALASEAGILPQSLMLTAISHLGEDKAKAQIFWSDQTVVARLEMGNAATTHFNGVGRPRGLPPVVGAPHVHLWSTNRHLLLPGRKLSRLEFAEPVPAEISGWEEVVRWFLTLCSIEIPRGMQFGLPRPETLL